MAIERSVIIRRYIGGFDMANQVCHVRRDAHLGYMTEWVVNGIGQGERPSTPGEKCQARNIMRGKAHTLVG